MVQQHRFKKRFQKCYRKLLNMSTIPQSTTQTNSTITNGQQLPRNSCNGFKVLSWKKTTPYYQSLYTIVSIHCCFKQKPRYSKAIFKIWISVYGSAKKFLPDKGGEFANDNFIQFCKNFEITVKTTAAKSTWRRNDLVECQSCQTCLTKSYKKTSVNLTLLLLEPSMPKSPSETSTDFHLTNYQLAPTQNYHL